MADIRVVLIGIGNASSVFLQGLHYYKDNIDEGLWHKIVGNYKVSDIKVVGGFDIDARKINKDLSEAILTKYVNVPYTGITVKPGILKDELPAHLKDIINVKSVDYEEMIRELLEMKPDIIVNLISSGLDNTSRLYAEAAIEVNADFINATPTNLKDLIPSFDKHNLIFVGDDLMSQFGGTAFHKGMIDFIVERGIKIEKSYQLDVGGTIETLNTMHEKIKDIKRGVKTASINIESPYAFESVAGTTEYTQFLNDSRVSYYWMKGKGFLNTPITIDIVLRTHDGTNVANVLLDVIRAIKYCKDCNRNDLKDIIAAYGFKNIAKIKRIRDAYKEFIDAFVSKV